MQSTDTDRPRIAIVDFGMGNLYSVKRACEHFGLTADITSKSRQLQAADAVVLPGVGAFGDAMDTLRQLDLIGPLKDIAASPTPLLGICLGFQLLMDGSTEFGEHRGLGIIPGVVVGLRETIGADSAVKIPHVGWNRIKKTRDQRQPESEGIRIAGDWENAPLAGVPDDAFLYFVHSYHVVPEDARMTLAVTTYGDAEFCAALQHANIFACQFHPERSGPAGLRIYESLATSLTAVVPQD